MTTMIHVNNLSKRFGKKRVLSDISFEVEPGEIIGLIGKNGAGKSTLINLMLGLTEPSDGTIKVFGKLPEQKRPKPKLASCFRIVLVWIAFAGMN